MSLAESVIMAVGLLEGGMIGIGDDGLSQWNCNWDNRSVGRWISIEGSNTLIHQIRSGVPRIGVMRGGCRLCSQSSLFIL